MLSFLANRVVTTIPIIIFITVAVFSVMQLLPGDPTLAILGDEATPQSRAVLRERMGLNRPVHVQYLTWLGGIFTGDLGRSLVDNTPVTRAVGFAFPVTLQIAIVSLFISISIGVPLGILSAVKRGGFVDALSSIFALSAISVPAFWAGILLMYFAALQLGWFPSSGFVRWADDPIRSLHHSILPATALALRPIGIFMRMTRGSMLEVINSDFVRTARAKGATEISVNLRHALRNALIPLFTLIGLEFSGLMGGVIVIDTLFAIPGFGRLIYSAFLRSDFVMMQSLMVLFSLIVIVVNLLTDISYSIIDPRIRYS